MGRLADSLRETRSLDAVLSLSELISSSPNLSCVLELCCQTAFDLLAADFTFFIRFSEQYATGEIVRSYPPAVAISQKPFAVAAISEIKQLLEKCEPVLLDEPICIPGLTYLRSTLSALGINISTILMIPVITRNRVAAALCVVTTKGRTYSDVDLKIARLIATQSALALNSDEGHQLSVLHDSSLAITSELEPDKLFIALTKQALRLLHVQSAGLYQYSPGLQQLTLIADTQGRYEGVTLKVGEGMVGTLVASDEPYMIVPDYRKWEGRATAYEKDQPYGAVMGVPLYWRGQCVGILYVADYKERKFSLADAESLARLANQAAIALEQHARIRRLERLQSTTTQITRELGRPDVVRSHIVHSASSIFNADFVTLWPYDQELEDYISDDLTAFGLDEESLRMIRENPPGPDRTAETVRKVDWLHEGDMTESLPYMDEIVRQKLLRMGMRSFQGIVLRAHQETLGVIFLGYKTPRKFCGADRAPLLNFADYAALALRQAKLFDQLQAFARAGQTIAHQTTLGNVKETLRAVAQSTKQALNCQSVVLYSYDSETTDFDYPPTSVGIETPHLDWPGPQLSKDSLVRKMIRLDCLHAATSITNDAYLSQANFPKRHGVISCAVVPLIVGEERIGEEKKDRVGLLFVNYTRKHQFREEELIRIQFFADHAAIAIRNAQLIEKRERQLVHQTNLAAITHELLKTVGLERTLARAVQLAATALGTSHSNIALLDERSGELILAAATGSDEALVRTQTLAKGPDSHEGCIIAQGRAIQFSDHADSEEYLGFAIDDNDPGAALSFPILSQAQTSGWRAAVGVPISIDKRIVGALLVQSSEPRRFRKSEILLVRLIADQTAVAIKSARQYQTLELQSAHLTALVHSGSFLPEVGASLNKSGTKATLNREKILNDILQEAVKSIRPHQRRKLAIGTIQLYNPIEDQATVTGVFSVPDGIAHSAHGTTRELRRRLDRGERIGVTGRAILSGETQIVFDVNNNSDFLRCCPDTLSEIAVPILEGAQVLGAISLESDLLGAFDQSDLDNLQALANLAVVIFQRTRDADQLNNAYHDLRLADERKTWFLTVLSHELRSPLQSVSLFIEAILKDSFGFCNSALRHGAEAALDRVIEETGLIENLLDMVKIHEGRLLLTFSTANIGKLLQQVYHTFHRPATQKQVGLFIDSPINDELTMEVDEGKIKQVLNNLTANALKFTGAGGEVRLSAKRLGQSIAISVKDTGRGIPLEAHARLFKRFFQFDREGADREGLGLGLTIVKQYVDLHGGSIMVNSKPNRGSEFIITLPVQLAANRLPEKTLPAESAHV